MSLPLDSMGSRGEAASTAPENRPAERVRLRVLYDFEYETRGKTVQIIKDERLLLLRKTNQDWWQVVRPVDVCNFYVPEQATFYVPTGYVLQEDPLPESTRFYVDKDTMFKSTDNPEEKVTKQQHSTNHRVPHLDHKSQEINIAKEETRKPHDSFRNVIRKLSGNLANAHDINKTSKSNKPSKIIKSLRKNSADSNDDGKSSKSNLSIVPAKCKDTWDNSAFGMCFGRDTKVNDVQVLNPFQEELESALSNRVSQRKATSDSIESQTKRLDCIVNDTNVCPKFESIQDKWEKASSLVLKKPNNYQLPLPFLKIEDAEKKASALPNEILTEMADGENCGRKRLLKCEKAYSVIEKNVKRTEQPLKKPNSEEESTSRLDENLNRKMKIILDKKLIDHNGRLVEQVTNKAVGNNIGKTTKNLSNSKKKENCTAVKTLTVQKMSKESREKSDMDKFLINDKRKMWAIETLMSELMESASNSKTISNKESNESVVSGANKLAQELHEMNVSRRFENAEIQVNLLEDREDKEEKSNCELEKRRKKIFDFPRSSMAKISRSPTARSPKLLDEYNEANILNDNDKAKESREMSMSVKVPKYEDFPSYSNISLRHKKDEKVGKNLPNGEMRKLKIPSKDFREELQLTPSLEKLASEIKFLPSSTASCSINGNSSDVESADWSGLVALSQDSLRLYKRYSKSDGALNKREAAAGQRGNVASQLQYSQSQWQLQANPMANPEAIIEERPEPVKHQLHGHERKYAQQRCNVKSHELAHEHCFACYRGERPIQTVRYKLNRKSRSLGDLDCSDIEGEKQQQDDAAHLDSRRRYKPVPKLRSKESFRRIEQTEQIQQTRPAQLAQLAQPAQPARPANEEDLLVKPVPAKRKMQLPTQATAGGSLDDLSEIDIERSTAVGFKMLLRTSDSGSEEYLQYKSFPEVNNKIHQLVFPSENNANELNRSISSNSCSSASPSHLLDHDSSLENLVSLPPGWTQTYDTNAKRLCFLNDQGDKWFSSSDSEGKIYFFEENSNQSSWALPTIINENRVRTLSNSDWPQLFDGNMCILKEGVVNKTKITAENGKKLKKAWSSSYAVLTELFLLFFKDAKTFATMKMDPSAAAKPDISVDLNGAFIEATEKLSNRKNVYLLNTLLGLQVLIQSDNPLVIQEWYREIYDAIQRLPFCQEYGRISTARE